MSSSETRHNLKDFDAYTDRNGQNFGTDEPLDVARPAALAQALESDPSWQAEVARIAAGRSPVDSVSGGSVATVEETEAETPDENIKKISDPSLSSSKAP